MNLKCMHQTLGKGIGNKFIFILLHKDTEGAKNITSLIP